MKGRQPFGERWPRDRPAACPCRVGVSAAVRESGMCGNGCSREVLPEATRKGWGSSAGWKPNQMVSPGRAPASTGSTRALQVTPQSLS